MKLLKRYRRDYNNNDKLTKEIYPANLKKRTIIKKQTTEQKVYKTKKLITTKKTNNKVKKKKDSSKNENIMDLIMKLLGIK